MHLLLRNTPTACCGDSKGKATRLFVSTSNMNDLNNVPTNLVGDLDRSRSTGGFDFPDECHTSVLAYRGQLLVSSNRCFDLKI